MGIFSNEICNDYLQSQGPIAMFQELSLNFKINNHGLRYEIRIDPAAFRGAKVVCQTLNSQRTGNSLLNQLWRFLYMLCLRKWTYKQFKEVLTE
jgi:hypothetical protein